MSEFLWDLSDGVATITLNRPERLNAISRPLLLRLLEMLDKVDEDDSVRAVIFTGAGRAFCAGADLSSGSKSFDYDKRPEYDPADANAKRDWGGLFTLRMFNLKKPSIAAVNGDAAGFGVTMQLAMDVRLAVKTARFVFPFARRGIVPESASAWFLPRIVGISKALEWCYAGRKVPAEEALAAGLVRDLYEPDELLPAARALAREMTSESAPVSVALTRQMLWRMMGAAHPMEAHIVDSRGVTERGKSGDAKEGVAAFLEKRTPNFPDRVSADVPDIFPDWREPEFR